MPENDKVRSVRDVWEPSISPLLRTQTHNSRTCNVQLGLCAGLFHMACLQVGKCECFCSFMYKVWHAWAVALCQALQRIYFYTNLYCIHYFMSFISDVRTSGWIEIRMKSGWEKLRFEAWRKLDRSRRRTVDLYASVVLPHFLRLFHDLDLWVHDL